MTQPYLASRPRVELVDHDIVAPESPRGTCIYLHGFGADKHQLTDLASALTPEGWATCRPTLRGHRGSPAPEWGYSVLEYAADVHRLADALPKPLIFIGYSLGALLGSLSLATWAATYGCAQLIVDQTYAAHPDRMLEDAHAEGRYLRWMYDFTGLLRSPPVPTRFLVARESHMVEEDERVLLDGLARDGVLECDLIAGTHQTCLDDVTALVGASRSFIDEVTASAKAVTR